jgi:serine/threonine-protein kinase
MPPCPDDGKPSSGPDAESHVEPGLESVRRAVNPLAEPSVHAHQHQDAPSQASTLETERFIEREVIGHGGSSVVIRAFDKAILRDVAIKVFDPDFVNDGSEIDRFAEEAQLTGQLEHPNIVPVYELSFDQRGRRFLSMKLIEGATLEKALNRLGSARLDPARLAEFLQVFVKVCDAVSFAHSRRVIHRDLKPRNIMVSDYGQVYVVDWGIARLRPPEAGREGARQSRVRVSPGLAEQSELDPPGSLVGTKWYMAPEQLRGLHDKVDERTDVFALGATLYEILTGQPPLTPEIVRSIWMRKVPPAIAPADQIVSGARVPPELSRIALRAMSYDPADRYASVEELKGDVEAFQRGAWDLPRTTLPAGSPIVTEGEPGSAAFVILEGQCLAYRVEGTEEVALRVMGPGDVFGETAVLTEKPRSASVKAVTDVVLVVVTREVMSNALGLNSWMAAFVKALAERFREVDERLRVSERQSRPPATRP